MPKTMASLISSIQNCTKKDTGMALLASKEIAIKEAVFQEILF